MSNLQLTEDELRCLVKALPSAIYKTQDDWDTKTEDEEFVRVKHKLKLALEELGD